MSCYLNSHLSLDSPGQDNNLESVLCHSLNKTLLSSGWSLFQQSPWLQGQTSTSSLLEVL